MKGRLDPTVRRLVLAMLIVHVVSLAGLGRSHAAAVNSSGSDLVNGMPCNDPCKAYMAWSDRMMARFAPQRPQERAEPRAVAHPKRPERTAHHATGTRRSGLNSLAQLPRRGGEEPQLAEPRQIEMASQPTGPTADQLFRADGDLTEQRTDAGSATSALSDAMAVPAMPMFAMPKSVADPVAATAEPVTTNHAASGPAKRLQISLALALCALLAFLFWGWIRVRSQGASAIQ